MSTDDSNDAEARAIKIELEAIRESIDTNTQQQRRRTTLQWVAIGMMGLVIVVVGALGLVGFLDDRADDEREDKQEVIDQQRACIAAMNARRDAEDRLTDLAKSLGARDSVITEIHNSYRDAPPPADCVTASSG